MAGRKRSGNGHHPADQETKRAERSASSGEHGTAPHQSSRQAEAEAGGSGHAERVPELDQTSASTSLGIDRSAQRDAGVSIPDSPYQKRG